MKPVLIRYPEGHALAGAEYELPDTDTARKVHPDAQIIMYADGTVHPSAPKDVKDEVAAAEKDREAREAAALEAAKEAQRRADEANRAAANDAALRGARKAKGE